VVFAFVALVIGLRSAVGHQRKFRDARVVAEAQTITHVTSLN